MSYFEVYNEKIHDLLVTREEPNQRTMPVSSLLFSDTHPCHMFLLLTCHCGWLTTGGENVENLCLDLFSSWGWESIRSTGLMSLSSQRKKISSFSLYSLKAWTFLDGTFFRIAQLAVSSQECGALLQWCSGKMNQLSFYSWVLSRTS